MKVTQPPKPAPENPIHDFTLEIGREPGEVVLKCRPNCNEDPNAYNWRIISLKWDPDTQSYNIYRHGGLVHSIFNTMNGYILCDTE